jgi:predicted small secreted protein
MKKLLFFAAFAVFSLSAVNAQEKVKEDIKKGAKAVEEGVKTGAQVVEKEAVKLYDQAKTGGFYLGANIGLPLSTTTDISSFNFGFDASYLFEVARNVDVGLLVGFTSYKGDGEYTFIGPDPYDYKSTSLKEVDGIIINHKTANFVPIAVSGRYYFNKHRMFGGLDLGYAIKVSGDDEVGGGFYSRPKFGFVFGGHFAAIASFQIISGGVDYYDGINEILTVNGFQSCW